jgi:hypothetical protein
MIDRASGAGADRLFSGADQGGLVCGRSPQTLDRSGKSINVTRFYTRVDDGLRSAAQLS